MKRAYVEVTYSQLRLWLESQMSMDSEILTVVSDPDRRVIRLHLTTDSAKNVLDGTEAVGTRASL